VYVSVAAALAHLQHPSGHQKSNYSLTTEKRFSCEEYHMRRSGMGN